MNKMTVPEFSNKKTLCMMCFFLLYKKYFIFRCVNKESKHYAGLWKYSQKHEKRLEVRVQNVEIISFSSIHDYDDIASFWWIIVVFKSYIGRDCLDVLVNMLWCID